MRIAINGIGIAGPTLAYWLRRSGHEPALFERASSLRTGGYLIDFWGPGYEIAERMGIISTLRQRGYEMKSMRMVDRKGHEEAQVDLAPLRDTLHGRFVSIPRTTLADALVGACEGIPIQFGLSIVAIEPAETQSNVTLSDGRQERFDLIVGADGLHSKVRALAFGPEEQYEHFLDCYVAAFRIRGYPHRDELTYVSHTLRRHLAARVSLCNDETLMLLVCSAELVGDAPPRDRDQQQAILRLAFSDMGWEVPEMLDAMDRADDLYFDRVSQIHLPHWSTGRVALVGDSAACPSLLAGEGTSLGMLEAYVLAGELCRVDGDFQKAFREYEARLHAFVTTRQKSAVWFRGFLAPQTAITLAVRNLVLHAFALPFVAKPLLARSFHDFRLPEYGMS